MISAENNSATLEAITNKLINAKTTDGTKILLSEDQICKIKTIKTNLCSGDLHALHHSADDFEMVVSIINEHTSCQLSALFLLRLMVLSQSTSSIETSVINPLLAKLNSGLTAFSGVPSSVMAFCTLSNLLCNSKTREAIFTNRLDSQITDCTMSYLLHPRKELRQICATLIYNLTLICTPSKEPNGGWSPPPYRAAATDHLPELAVQILCSVLEGIPNESDSSIRKRRLATSCRIFRASTSPSRDLVNDLGFSSYFDELLNAHDTSVDEKNILHEISNYLL